MKRRYWNVSSALLMQFVDPLGSFPDRVDDCLTVWERTEKLRKRS